MPGQLALTTPTPFSVSEYRGFPKIVYHSEILPTDLEVWRPVSYDAVKLFSRDGLMICCLLVLDSVTSTPQWIRQPRARVYLKEGTYHTRLLRGALGLPPRANPDTSLGRDMIEAIKNRGKSFGHSTYKVPFVRRCWIFPKHAYTPVCIPLVLCGDLW